MEILKNPNTKEDFKEIKLNNLPVIPNFHKVVRDDQNGNYYLLGGKLNN